MLRNFSGHASYLLSPRITYYHHIRFLSGLDLSLRFPFPYSFPPLSVFVAVLMVMHFPLFDLADI